MSENSDASNFKRTTEDVRIHDLAVIGMKASILVNNTFSTSLGSSDLTDTGVLTGRELRNRDRSRASSLARWRGAACFRKGIP